MTQGPPTDEGEDSPEGRDDVSSRDDVSNQEDPPARPGLSTFTIEGRAAPALFVVGWLATVLGLGSILIAILAGNAPAVLILGLVFLAVGLVCGAGAQAIERRVRAVDPYTGPSPVLLFLATFPVAYLLAIVVGSLLEVLGVRAPQQVADLLLVTIQAVVNVGLVALLVVGTGALTWREIGFRGPGERVVVDLAWGAVFAVPVIAVTLVATSLLVAIFGAVPESPLRPTGEPIGLALNLLAGAVIAPISEEVLFRGVTTTAWVRSYGIWPGIVRAALFFALAHVLTLGGTTVAQALAVAIVGFAGRVPVAIALGWVFVRRDSIWASIGLHGAFNGILLILANAAFQAAGGS